MKLSINRLTFVVLFSIIFSYANNSHSQEIKGKITDDEGSPLSNVNVLVKDSFDSNAILTYSVSDNQGNYVVKTGNLSVFVIEFRSMAYVSKKVSFNDFSHTDDNPYLLNVTLEEDFTELKEVVVSAKKHPITVKNDTITYNSESFRDGTERVVEDLLKKLPGMKVDPAGRITFKGTPVEHVLLDGDNLFDENYTIGTKNIDVDMVEAVSAIENYIQNPLLHGIDNTNAVAINLTLKKGKTDFSGTANLGGGIESRADINTTLLGISKKIKSFSTVSYNNTGMEYSPYDYFASNILSFGSNSKEVDFKPDRIIAEGDFSSDVSVERARINSNFFTSINSVYTISDKLGAKVNFDFKNDRLERMIQSRTEYFDIVDNTDINQQELLAKKPELYNFKLDMNYKLSKNELIEYRARIKNEDINTSYDITLNDALQKSLTDSDEKQLQQVVDYTKRINSKTALISSFLFNKVNLSQNLFITPDLRFQNDDDSNQSVAIGKTNLNINAYLLNSGQDYNLKVGLGYTYENVGLYSLLSDNNTRYSENDLDYKNSFPWIDGNLFLRQNKWNFRMALKVNYLHQKLDNHNEVSNDKQNQKFQFLPKATITYNLSEKSNFRLTGIYNEKLISENFLYENVIFTSNRSAQTNILSLETIKNYSFDLSYNHNDFFNLFQFNSGIYYMRNINNFFNTIGIDDLFVVTQRELLNIGFDNLSLNTGLDKYVSFLKSNIKLNLTYGINTYKNRINDSETRDNTAHSVFSNFILKTGFLGSVNFENNVQYGNIAFKTDDLSTIYNSSIQNSLRMFVVPNQGLRLITSFEYYQPNIDKRENFIFFDITLNLTSKNQKINYAIIAKNLSPKKNDFIRTDISDFSNSITQYNLNHSYILFSVSFKF